MSSKGPKEKSHESKKHRRNVTEQALNEGSGNSSRRKKPGDRTEGITKSLQGVSLDGESRRSSGKTPRTQTATQPEKSLTKASKFIKVEVFGSFESRSRSAIVESYMASSSQLPPTMQGEEDVSRSMKVAMSGVDLHLATTVVIGDKENAPVFGHFDTGATVISVNRQYMLSKSLNEEDLNNSLVGNDKYARLRFTYPGGTIGDVNAPLHQDRFTFGGQSITVEKQSFYVLDQAPFPMVIGLSPPSSTGLVGHGIKDAPTLLQTIAKQHGLKEIMGFDVFPWSDTGNDWDVLKGSSIDFGGTDKNRYDESTLHYLSCPVQSSHYFHEPKGVTYGEGVNLMKTKKKVLIDSGARLILLPESIWKRYRRCLQDNGIKVYDHDEDPRLMAIKKRDLAKLQPLSFHFVDVEGKKFSIEIPLAGQVYPPSMVPAMGIHDDRMIVLTVVPSHNDFIMLGIPVFQRRYVIFDLTTNPYRIGFAEKEKTNYVNPSIQEIVDIHPRMAPITPR